MRVVLSRKLFLPGGAVAQLGARLDGIEEVVGSNPIGSTLLAHVFPRLYPFERNNKPLLRWSDAGRQRAPRVPQRELFQVAPESGAVAAGLSRRIQDPWPSHT